ncbi:MAG: zinc ribbon domain-containing protein [Clostridiales bacterium]|jgi:hypothetical protein|nr:zinc ribbon domain-containing protein [Clostridiales bacterium]
MSKCISCGADLEPGVKFCRVCGTKVEAPPAEEVSSTAGIDSPPAAKPKVSKSVITLAVAVIAVAVVAAVGVLAFNAFGGSSYKKAESKFLSALLVSAPVVSNKGAEVEFSVEYTPSDDIPGAELMDGFGASGTVAYAESSALADVMFSLDGDELKFIGAVSDGFATLQLPDITNYYLKFATATDSDVTVDWDSLDMNKLNKSVMNVVNKYFALVEENAEVEKGVELRGGDITVKCDRYTIDFDGKLVGELALTGIDELEKNKNLNDFIIEYAEAFDLDPDDYEDGLEEAKETITEFLEDEDEAEERAFRMTVWVSGGEVVSRKIDRISGEPDAVFEYTYLVKGNNAYVEAQMGDGYTTFEFDGSFEKSGKGWTGSIDGGSSDSYDSFDFTVDLTDVNQSGSQFTGLIEFSADIDDDESFDIELALSKDGSSQAAAISGEITSYGESYDIGELNLTYAAKVISSVKVPDLDEDLAVVVNDYSGDYEDNAEEMQDDLSEASEDMGEILGSLIDEILWLLY